jgi:hypothetical protein
MKRRNPSDGTPVTSIPLLDAGSIDGWRKS